jgi:hypothetical protein
MEADYPAAHSMDTTWFAADRDGHVGVFSTNAKGAIPGIPPDEDLFEAILLQAGVEELISLLAGGRISAGRYSEDYFRHVTRLGLFCYSHRDYWEVDLQGDYQLIRPPETPLHVDSLPPRFRKLARQNRLSRVHFPDTESVQPLEHFACRFFPDEDAVAAVAYVASDGVTLRPVPGREGEFAAFCEALWRDHPEQMAEFRFEGPAGSGNP